MGTACHCGHHNTFPAAFRTQSITSTEDEKAASEAAFHFFLNKEIVFVYVDLGHPLRLR